MEIEICKKEAVRKNRTTELFTELGEMIFDNLDLLDNRIIETDKFPDLKVTVYELLEIIAKIRELENE